ncbi:MAG TPA: bile acid:sodium symporter, partial [Armatimonadota bacterium]|nr:bile acid:sodium symporter [Armatimonadota bacterium]
SIVAITIAGGVVLHVVLLVLGHLSGRVIGVAEPERRALTFCSAQKSFIFNVLLANRLFIGNNLAFGLAILPGMIYYLIELTIDSVIAQCWHQRTPDTANIGHQQQKAVRRNSEYCVTR